MRRVLIAIVDAAHARVYTYQGENGEAALQEQRDLINAGRQAHGTFTTTIDHVAAMDVKFAKVVIDEVARLAREQGFHNVILVASPKMLGELRRASAPLHDFEVDEIAQDLAWLTSPQVHDHLAAMKLIDPRPRALARAR
jgi:protein required for attachment to host cells